LSIRIHLLSFLCAFFYCYLFIRIINGVAMIISLAFLEGISCVCAERRNDPHLSFLHSC
jgi:hypothetical protein